MLGMRSGGWAPRRNPLKRGDVGQTTRMPTGVARDFAAEAACCLGVAGHCNNVQTHKEKSWMWRWGCSDQPGGGWLVSVVAGNLRNGQLSAS